MPYRLTTLPTTDLSRVADELDRFITHMGRFALHTVVVQPPYAQRSTRVIAALWARQDDTAPYAAGRNETGLARTPRGRLQLVDPGLDRLVFVRSGDAIVAVEAARRDAGIPIWEIVREDAELALLGLQMTWHQQWVADDRTSDPDAAVQGENHVSPGSRSLPHAA